MRLPPSPTRDRLLDTAVRELLDCDPRLRRLRATAHTDGGVVHLGGEAPDLTALDTARDLIGRLAGVVAVWDRVRLPDQPPLRGLDVGCGAVKQHPDNLGVDQRPAAGVDIVADVRAPLPLRGASVDRAYAVHVIEHIPDILPLFAELHRVLAPHGVLHVLSPDWRHVNAVADPTHLHYLDVQTIKYFCTDHPRMPRWRPLHAGCDGPSVFADLMPVKDGVAPAADELLARWFD